MILNSISKFFSSDSPIIISLRVLLIQQYTKRKETIVENNREGEGGGQKEACVSIDVESASFISCTSAIGNLGSELCCLHVLQHDHPRSYDQWAGHWPAKSRSCTAIGSDTDLY